MCDPILVTIIVWVSLQSSIREAVWPTQGLGLITVLGSCLTLPLVELFLGVGSRFNFNSVIYCKYCKFIWLAPTSWFLFQLLNDITFSNLILSVVPIMKQLDSKLGKTPDALTRIKSELLPSLIFCAFL